MLCLILFGLQALTPAGYMPAALGSGWLFQLCPQGMAPEVMAILHAQHASSATPPTHSPIAADSHHGHHGHNNQHTNEHASSSTTVGTDATWTQCQFAGAVDPEYDGVSTTATGTQCLDAKPQVTRHLGLKLTNPAHTRPPARAPPISFLA